MFYLKGGCPSLYVREIINSYMYVMDFILPSFDFFSCKTHKNAVRKVCKELERKRQQEENQESEIAFDFKTR